MLGDFGEVYVMDWGIAKLLEISYDDLVPLAERSAESAVRPSVDRKKTSPHSILGTLAYAAPEQVTPSQKDSVDERTDVFALGAILFEMLTWKRARPVAAPEEMLKSITHPGQPRVSVRIPSHQVPVELEAIYTRAMQHSPQARYPSVAAMLTDLEQFLSGELAHDRLRQLTAHQRRLEGAGDEALAITLEPQHTERKAAPGTGASARGAGLAVLDTLPQIHTASSRSFPSRQTSPVTTAEHESSRPGPEDARVRTVAVVGVVLVFATLLALAMHVRDWGLIALLCAAGVVCSGMRIWNLIHPESLRLPYAVHLSSLLFFALLGRVFGPLSLMAMLVAMDTSLQATSPSRRFRRFAVLSSCAMVLGVALLEWSGVLSASYLFTQGGMLLRPNLMDLSPGPTYLVLMIVSMLAIAAPALNLGARSAR